MSIRGSVTIECDRKGCHAEIVLQAEDATVHPRRHGLELDLSAAEWREDGLDVYVCPQCATADENPRERDDDDGATYSDPRDAREERR